MISSAKNKIVEISLSYKYYIYSLAIWIYLFSLLTTTTYSNVVPGLVLTSVRLIILGLLTIRLYAINKTNFKSPILKQIVLIIFFTVIAIRSGDIYLIDTIFIILSIHDIKFEKIIKIIMIVLLIVFIQTILSSQIGLIENRVFYRTYTGAANYGIRQSLGFVYTTILSVYYFHITSMYLFISKSSQKLSYLESISIIFGAVLVQYLTDSRLTFFLTLLSVFVFQIMKIFDFTPVIKNVVFKKVVAYGVMTLIGLVILTPIFYNQNNELFVRLNNLFSNRITISQEAYNDYGVSLFGENIKMVGNADIHYYVGEEYDSNYFYLDSSFIYILMKYGLLMLVIVVLAIYKVLSKNFISQYQYRIVILLVLIILNGILNPQFFMLMYNPTLFILFNSNYGGTGNEIGKQAEN